MTGQKVLVLERESFLAKSGKEMYSYFVRGKAHGRELRAYFFQETVNLDFDIIDVTFSNGETETILPVVSNPIDVLPDVTPPVHTTSDEEPTWLKRLKKALAVILLCVLVFALLPILPTILDILVLPFKAIGKWLGGGNKKE